MVKEFLRTVSYVDFGSILPAIIAVLAWPICAIIGYRFGLRSKKKELEVTIINEIREEAINYIGEIIEVKNRKNWLDNCTKILLQNIDEIVARNIHILGFWKQYKINKTMKKIIKLATIICDDPNPTNDKYRKRFYKILCSIGIYD